MECPAVLGLATLGCYKNQHTNKICVSKKKGRRDLGLVSSMLLNEQQLEQVLRASYIKGGGGKTQMSAVAIVF